MQMQIINISFKSHTMRDFPFDILVYCTTVDTRFKQTNTEGWTNTITTKPYDTSVNSTQLSTTNSNET